MPTRINTFYQDCGSIFGPAPPLIPSIPTPEFPSWPKFAAVALMALPWNPLDTWETDLDYSHNGSVARLQHIV